MKYFTAPRTLIGIKNVIIYQSTIDFVPLQFIRTSNTDVDFFFSFDVTFLTSDTKSIRVYETVKNIFHDSASDFEGLVETRDSILVPDALVQHSFDKAETFNVASPDSLSHYSVLKTEAYAIFNLRFDSSKRINKMIVTHSNKYLGRYSPGDDEERTDVLL